MVQRKKCLDLNLPFQVCNTGITCSQIHSLTMSLNLHNWLLWYRGLSVSVFTGGRAMWPRLKGRLSATQRWDYWGIQRCWKQKPCKQTQVVQALSTARKESPQNLAPCNGTVPRSQWKHGTPPTTTTSYCSGRAPTPPPWGLKYRKLSACLRTTDARA